jgi:raffinose/stachyose/melibiose transport system permease protein
MRTGTAIRLSAAVVLAVLFGYPLVWMGLTSLRTEAAVRENAWAPPSVPPHLGNYERVVRDGRFGRYYLNSVVVCGTSVLVACLVSAAAAYAFARMRFRGKEALFLLFLAGMVIPVHVTLVPLHGLMSRVGLLNTVGALIGPYVAFALPVSVLILRTFFEALPREMEEAARLDGCGAFRTFWYVALPLSAPALATVFIFNFVHMWNEFAFALTLNSDASATLPVGIWKVAAAGPFADDLGAVSAGLVVGVLPGLVVYFLAQRHIVRGMTAGALTG